MPQWTTIQHTVQEIVSKQCVVCYLKKIYYCLSLDHHILCSCPPYILLGLTIYIIIVNNIIIVGIIM